PGGRSNSRRLLRRHVAGARHRRAREGAKQVEGCCCAGGAKSNCCRPCGLSGPRESRRRVRARALARVARIRCERVDAHRRREAAMSITREEIRQLCIAHDRFMAEQGRETITKAPVSENDEPDLIFKDFDNGTLQAAAGAADGERDWSGWESWIRGHLDIEREIIRTVVADVFAERDADMTKLRSEIAELKGRVDVLLSLVTKGGADVVSLPRKIG